MKKWMKKTTDVLKKGAPYWVSAAILMGASAVFFVRLADWQIVHGEEYLEQANKTSVFSVSLDAARGEILDVNGEPLAVNQTAYKVVFEKAYMTTGTENKTIHTLIQLMKNRKETWIDELPIILDANGQYAFMEDKEEEIAELKGKNFLNLNSYATAEMCMKKLIENYDCDTEAYTPQEIRDIVSVRYSMTLGAFSVSNPYTFAQGISKETVAVIEENSQSLPGVNTQITTIREYPDGSLAPHIVGSMGVISQEEYDSLKDKGYAYNDRLGKSGIESAFESELRGTAGKQVIETTRTGSVASSTVTQEPVPGNTVFTTIDANLQKVANASLAKNVKAAQAAGKASSKELDGEDCVAGAVVVLDVKDFSVLAAATYPSYDLTAYANDSNYYNSLVNDSATPLFNRAFNGAFTPGSVFKPAVAAAALQEGIITADTKINCTGTYEYYAPSYRPKCMNIWGHGNISLRSALAKSCNVYFYEVGRLLGIKNIDAYAESFGLGVKTGIELSENEGILASPEYRTSAGGVWNPGDVIQAAIGQADNSFTPLQLATYCATIANDGTRLQTHLIRKITNYNRDKVIMENDPENPTVVEKVDVSPENLKLVQEGMRAVCSSEGTASIFANYGVAIAGKTGTAEVPNHSDNTVFIGYAPYDKPEIAVAVILEYGAKGTYSTGVAKDIFDAYFFGKTVDENGNMTTPSISDSMNGLTIGAQAAAN